MIIAGSDVSGNVRRGGQKRYIAFVVGTEERVNKIYKNIGLKEIHMAKLSDPQREYVYQKLNLQHSEILAWCFEVEKQNIVHYIFNHPRLHPRTRSKESIEKKFDHHLLRAFKNTLENFTYSHKIGLKDLTVECDSDMFYTVEYWGMKNKYRGKAYELSDAIAWFNEKSRKIKQCAPLNLKDEIKNKMESELLE